LNIILLNPAMEFAVNRRDRLITPTTKYNIERYGVLMIEKFLIVGCGGFFGAISRYALSGLVHRWFDGRFPYGTILVNIIGSFLLGFLMYLVQTKAALGPGPRLFLTIGLLGAFTTYSTFAYESYELLLGQRYTAAAVNILMHLIIGIGAVWGAIIFAKTFIK